MTDITPEAVEAHAKKLDVITGTVYGADGFKTAVMLRALSARVAELEAASAWQPIETAPMNGATILIAWDTAYMHPITEEANPEEFSAWGVQPTHWQPLPTPPKG